MRNNINVLSLSEKTLGVASSCDLEFFVKYLRAKKIFREINYNFEKGTSDDASIEILRPDNVISRSDIAVLSVAETAKKLFHPLIHKQNIDHGKNFSLLAERLASVVNYVKSSGAEAAFLFKYPFDRTTLDINDRPWMTGSASYWIDKVDRLYVDTLSECDNKIDLIDFDEVFLKNGNSEEYFRPDLWGGHPEKPGAEILANLFLERLISRIDKKSKIKAIALDLDNTLWKGVFLESKTMPKLDGNRVTALYQHVSKGIPVCIVSKNNPEDAEVIKSHLKSSVPGLFRNIVSYYVNWDPKSASISRMAKDLGISLDTIAFFDDNAFERGEVNFSLPDVKVYAETEIVNSLRYAEFSFSSLSDDAKNRVSTYKENSLRTEYEVVTASEMTLKDYLHSLHFKIKFINALPIDLDRAEELIHRTNQQNLLLNRTARDNIRRYIDDGRCVMISLQDKFGDYGTIGVILFDVNDNAIRLQELAISCRALGKGVEECIIAYLNKRFGEYANLSFNVVKNYKNEAFFQKFLEEGFVFDEISSNLMLNPDATVSYPEWFEVI